ncbi:MAG: hypothetical protein OCC49_03650 [Fibrobacterales bacterium]
MIHPYLVIILTALLSFLGCNDSNSSPTSTPSPLPSSSHQIGATIPDDTTTTDVSVSSSLSAATDSNPSSSAPLVSSSAVELPNSSVQSSSSVRTSDPGATGGSSSTNDSQGSQGNSSSAQPDSLLSSAQTQSSVTTVSSSISLISSSLSSSTSVPVSSSSVTVSSSRSSSSSSLPVSSSSISSSVSSSSSVVSFSSAVSGHPGTVTVPISKDSDWARVHMGDIELFRNTWGSELLKCDSDYEIFVDAEYRFGWEFDRGACQPSHPHNTPDYPEIEIGASPFNNSDRTASPTRSSTAILPLQVKNIMSATITIDSLAIDLEKSKSWNVNFEMWLTKYDPTTTNQPQPKVELMTFWGWHSGRWKCDRSKMESKFGTGITLDAGTEKYTLCHQDDSWGSGDWKYYQFRADDGSMNEFTGVLDVKVALDWLVTTAGISDEYWVTRFEIGSEIGDDTKGTVIIKDVVFEVNGSVRTPQFAP